jgi:hypothetical protein
MKKKRMIINATDPVLEVYRVSDNYLKECAKNKHPTDNNLISYLDQSEYFMILLDTNYDIFEKTKIDDFRTMRSDGKWIWSADLNFYTLNYGFKWPDDFIRHVKKEGKCVVSDKKLKRLIKKCAPTVFFLQSNIKVENYDAVAFKELGVL